MKKLYIRALVLGGLLTSGSVRAQLVIDGTNFSNFGYVSNYDAYTQVTNRAGSSYSAGNGATFDHFETDVDALRVFNPYNANGSGGSTDNFNGPNGSAGTMGISGNVAPNFYNLVLKNGASSLFNINNSAGANVYNQATFQNGITTTVRSTHQASALRFEASSSYSGGSTDAQHVNGYVSKIGNTAFTFPVGSGSDIRTLAIAAPADAATHLSTAWFPGDPSTVTDPSDNATHSTSTVTGPITSVSTAGFWDFVKVAGSSSLDVTVSMPDLSGFAPASDLRLVGWNGSSWIDLSGNANASGNAENSTLSGTVPVGINITALAIGSITQSPTPVSLMSFQAQVQANRSVLLTWQTAQEKNNQAFILERSKDLLSFETVGKVTDVAGNSTQLSSYRLVDNQPYSGTSYYRLTQVDTDGKQESFKAVSVVIDATYRLYPNPVTNRTITLELDEPLTAKIKLFEATGREVSFDRIPASGQSIQLQPLTQLSPGIYLLLVQERAAIRSYKVVVP
ncbi:T9SS type A sorting domain-containing protein [Siphonobacter sp. SORGH_AS_0500]|uniref:T9SS type A sorting domain-containing protein n=1 Tax=Siphonobacter sp. SORGH_AS_0500 TaxID=1864824 RepID=UPI0028657BB6|nr:T9SS type A sorting domain-containing protein [Siphonobacter sp. SORGH_AS_0500]MDR6197576.1 hypothetical protein [Siphonobacter sp. SORGH_AS_0500]